MNAVAKIVAAEPAPVVEGLALLRKPFEPHHISKLPKETRTQIDARKDPKTGRSVMVFNCVVCGGHHHKEATHLDYVGHAALTDRLLDADPNWSWEPAALRDGLPAFDQTGGLWIKLTVCGVTRLGYGHAAAKPQQDPGAREKEIIGDALRNAAMRFGAALDLWHKGDLHPEEEAPQFSAEQGAIAVLRTHENDPEGFKAVWAQNKDAWKGLLAPDAYVRVVGVMKEIGAKLAAKSKPEPQDDPFRGEPAGGVSGRSAHQQIVDAIGDDEIPF